MLLVSYAGVRSLVVSICLGLMFHCLPVIASAHTVQTGDELVSYLCGPKLVDESTISLSHSIEYEISMKHSCQVKSIPSLTIRSDSTDCATVRCTSQNLTQPVSNTLFAFVNMSILIENVKFSGCGAHLSRIGDLLSEINSSSLYFTETHSAFMVFVDSAITFQNVEISNYFGFGILGINLKSSVYFKFSLTNSLGQTLQSNENHYHIGSGILLMFTETNTAQYSDHRHPASHILFNVSKFSANFEITAIKDKQCVVSHFKCYSTKTPPRCQVINSAALTVIFYNLNNDIGPAPIVSIEESLFKHNYGSFCSGVMVLMLNSTYGKVKIKGNTQFINSNNLVDCLGSYLSFYATNTNGEMNTRNQTAVSPLIVSETIFNNNKREFLPTPLNKVIFKDSSAVLISAHDCTAKFDFVFENVSFEQNIGAEFGTSFAAIVYDEDNSEHTEVHILLKNLYVEKNEHTNVGLPLFEGGILAFNGIDSVTIDGTQDKPSTFISNIGSCINARNTAVYIKGTIIFRNNIACRGASFLLIDSTLHFEDGLRLVAVNNSAKTFGGVIYAHNFNSYTYELPNCALQFENNVSCDFSDNEARIGGSSIYASPISSCYSKATDSVIHSLKYYTKYFNFVTNSSLQSISTVNQNISECSNSSDDVDSHYYPGQTILLWFYASGDEDGTHVYAEVRVNLVRIHNEVVFESKSEINEDEKFQFIHERRNCSLIKVTIAFKDVNTSYSLGVAVSSSLHYSVIQLKSSFFNGSCPHGFMLNRATGICDCSNATKRYFRAVYYPEGKCDIETLTISRPSFIASPWIGTFLNASNKTIFGLTDLCPFDYCTSNNGLSRLKYDKTNQRYSYLLNDTQDLRLVNICREHREGVICGKCQEGYSVVFGSSECKKCSNEWLLTIVLYAVSGPLVLLILYGLNLTLTTGTINGIIFFGQAANFNILPFLCYFPSSLHGSGFISVFLSLLNFNLGFPLCFFDGMTEVHKIGLSLVFPIYLFAIICVIVVASRYSTWLSNRTSNRSIQVFATVVHISIAGFIVTLMDVFTTAKIFVDDIPNSIHVWYRDPNPNETEFIVLKVLVILITLVVLAPYLFLLIGGRWLLRFPFFSNHLRAVYEAIHGPYKENRKYWFLARLVFLMYMFVLYSVWRGNELHDMIVFTLTALIIFVVLQEYLKPFKKKLIGVLDSFIMMCMVMLYLIAWYQSIGFKFPNLELLYILMFIPVIIVFLLFVLVVLYHVLMIVPYRFCSIWKQDHNVSFSSQMDSIKADEASPLLLSGNREKVFPDYREPLLSFDDAA